jgi:hypothetical protein
VATAFQPNAFQDNAFQIDGSGGNQDGALSATGTGTATFVGESTAVAPFSVTGTGTASFVGASTAVAPFSMTGTGAATFVGAGTASSVLAATATGTGLFTGASDASGVLSATGTGTASFVGLEISTTGALAATGTVTASFAGDYDAFNCGLVLNDGTSYILLNDDTSVLLLNDDSCLAPPAPYSTGALSASGSAAAAFVGASQDDSVLSVTGTATASFVGDFDAAGYNCGLLLNDDSFILLNDGASVFLLNDASCLVPPAPTTDAALGASGSGAASFVGDFDTAYNCGLLLNDGAFVLLNDGTSVFLLNDASCPVPPSSTTDAVLDASGSGTASFVGASDEVAAATADGGGVAAPGAWRVRKKKQKKKDELDDLIAQLKEQIVPYREAQEVGAQIMLRAELEHALTVSLDGTLDEIESEIAALKEVLAEMDDEEALLLLM